MWQKCMDSSNMLGSFFMLGVNFVTCFFPYKHNSSVRIAWVDISSYGDTWPPAGAQLT